MTVPDAAPASLRLFAQAVAARDANVATAIVSDMVSISEHQGGLTAARALMALAARHRSPQLRDCGSAWELCLGVTAKVVKQHGWSVIDSELYSRILSRTQASGHWQVSIALAAAVATGAAPGQLRQLHPSGPPAEVCRSILERHPASDLLRAFMVLDACGTATEYTILQFIDRLARDGNINDVRRGWERLRRSQAAAAVPMSAGADRRFTHAAPYDITASIFHHLQIIGEWKASMQMLDELVDRGAVSASHSLSITLTVACCEGNIYRWFLQC